MIALSKRLRDTGTHQGGSPKAGRHCGGSPCCSLVSIGWPNVLGMWNRGAAVALIPRGDGALCSTTYAQKKATLAADKVLVS